ncbi:putative ABC transport system ATP-binding protein [Aureibacter tunicatorum]|uniref:ABC transport system ATP-binding protein n=1 Tax=Aureibacter tunicatorum TaxID=866807 RepID=A0AAE3XR06_9BACT|nr:putative ABC transport system ATP-binding protein [Aureibacter tunicatorum]
MKQGEFVSIMGPSGCGKSSLINILGMLEAPNEGALYFEEKLVSGLSEKALSNKRKGKVSFVFQNFNLIDELNVYDNIELPLMYLNLPRKERQDQVQRVMERVEIAHRAEHLPHELSGGQQQRVAIARAVVTRPKLILADEPTGNLDSHLGNEVMDLLLDLKKDGSTIIMVTHSQLDADKTDRILHLFDGKIIGEKVLKAPVIY